MVEQSQSILVFFVSSAFRFCLLLCMGWSVDFLLDRASGSASSCERA